MTAHSELRLLPWSGPDGKPCYLSTDDDSSHLSRLADTTEAIQLGLADNLVKHAVNVLDDEAVDPEELRELSADLVGALRDALRVATSRGQRLVTPQLPARGGDASP
ncbi:MULTISPECIES: YbaB/EbfC family nucleoid-associated protein [unclassified Streptomyces]|uniref:YbaB/EbfC family nucleoid-associated protein n=1 Tax=unclassified Streptomyces TaxID=2593676 RepID=UPI000701FFE8|nr:MULTISPECIES: YbaB/EbfC family nucleoid-associated protein [unclassified Streptomyces]KQX57984.1 hypothetical protein ASD33_26235 [Streptomyces sp. Root1304]KRA95432.1 hypothetical protein ASE09_28635 [Streptomyces sp. Root66D1]